MNEKDLMNAMNDIDESLFDFEEKKNRSGVRNEKKERKVKRTKDGSRQREKK